MSNDTEYNDFDIDQLNEETETELDTEHVETEEVEDDNDEVAKLRSENKKLVEIIKRRKEREAQAPQETKQTINKINNTISREEAILFAQGFSEEDVDHLNLVAKGSGLSIKEAREHPLFVSYMEKQDMEKKARKASMGTSKGSSTTKKVDLSNLSEDEHKAVWFKTIGINQ
jgi:hypothetical protein